MPTKGGLGKLGTSRVRPRLLTRQPPELETLSLQTAARSNHVKDLTVMLIPMTPVFLDHGNNELPPIFQIAAPGVGEWFVWTTFDNELEVKHSRFVIREWIFDILRHALMYDDPTRVFNSVWAAYNFHRNAYMCMIQFERDPVDQTVIVNSTMLESGSEFPFRFGTDLIRSEIFLPELELDFLSLVFPDDVNLPMMVDKYYRAREYISEMVKNNPAVDPEISLKILQERNPALLVFEFGHRDEVHYIFRSMIEFFSYRVNALGSIPAPLPRIELMGSMFQLVLTLGATSWAINSETTDIVILGVDESWFASSYPFIVRKASQLSIDEMYKRTALSAIICPSYGSNRTDYWNTILRSNTILVWIGEPNQQGALICIPGLEATPNIDWVNPDDLPDSVEIMRGNVNPVTPIQFIPNLVERFIGHGFKAKHNGHVVSKLRLSHLMGMLGSRSETIRATYDRGTRIMRDRLNRTNRMVPWNYRDLFLPSFEARVDAISKDITATASTVQGQRRFMDTLDDIAFGWVCVLVASAYNGDGRTFGLWIPPEMKGDFKNPFIDLLRSLDTTVQVIDFDNTKPKIPVLKQREVTAADTLTNRMLVYYITRTTAFYKFEIDNYHAFTEISHLVNARRIDLMATPRWRDVYFWDFEMDARDELTYLIPKQLRHAKSERKLPEDDLVCVWSPKTQLATIVQKGQTLWVMQLHKRVYTWVYIGAGGSTRHAVKVSLSVCIEPHPAVSWGQ